MKINQELSLDSAAENRLNTWKRLTLPAVVGIISLSSVACVPQIDGTDGDDPKPDGTYSSALCEAESGPPALPEGYSYGYWKPIVLNDVVPGNDYVCGNGEPYRFFVKINEGASDLVVSLEGGGACWDEQTCFGNSGVLMANKKHPSAPDALTKISQTEIPGTALHPQFGRIDNGVPTNKYNQVYLPYCTADVFAGDVVNHYASGPVHHKGRHNVEGVAEYLTQHFSAGKTGQLLTMGTSAGGVGTMVNYALIRDAVDPTCSAGINDAGPIFPQNSDQKPTVDLIIESLHLEGIIDELDNRLETDSWRTLNADFGNISHGLAKTFPDDRFMLASFKEDLNFSVFSFASSGVVQPGPNFTEQILQKWDSALQQFVGFSYSQPENNWGFYFPVFRKDNCSHGVAITPFSMGHDTSYFNDAVDGKAHGYHRTELQWNMMFDDLVWDENHEPVVEQVLRRRHFGDAIRQLLDPEQSVPRYTDYRNWDQLTFRSPDGIGTTDEVWYEDFTGALIEDQQDWVNRQSDPNWCPQPGNVDQCSCAYIGDYQAPAP